MTANILCLDDEKDVLLSIRVILKEEPSYYTHCTSTWEDAQLILETESIDLLLLDYNLGKGKPTGLELIPKIKHKFPNVDIILVTGERDPKLFKQALELGAADYFQKPAGGDLLLAVQKLERKRDKDHRCSALFQEISKTNKRMDFIGRSPEFLKVIEKAACMKGQTASVLIEAETGTGKELLAKHIHGLEGDPKRPFIAIDCGALAKGVVESELFGHEKGSFTGAQFRQMGKFQLAHGGDIFLDEINSLEPDIQAKLLRVLQEKVVFRVGSKHSEPADFRVIAASNEDLKKLVAQGRFREDLYHRLNVVRFVLPPLRKRREDIPLLVDHFIAKHDKSGTKRISATAMRFFMNYEWPGNIRELENLVHQMVILSKKECMDVENLPEHIINVRVHPAILKTIKAVEENLDVDDDLFSLKMHDFVKIMRVQYIQRAVKQHSGNLTQAAKKLGLTRQTIYQILKEANDYGRT